MDSLWALEVMHKAPYITVSFIDEEGKPYTAYRFRSHQMMM